MLRRLATLAMVLALAAPPAALAQGQGGGQDPFPLNPQQPQQPQPTAAPPPEEDDGGFLGLNNEIGGSATLYIIAAGLLAAFVAIGMFISRDARRSLPAHHRPDAHRLRDEGPHKHKRQAKAKARARGKAQRDARRRNR